MTRTRKTAKDAGTRFESLVAGFLAVRLADDRIERRAKTGPWRKTIGRIHPDDLDIYEAEAEQ